jgi:hypothetical protein
LTEGNIKYFNFKNYNLNFLPKSRQIASGILIRTHKPLKHIFSTVERMNDVDKVEIKLNVWRNNNHVKVSGIYNPPLKTTLLSLLLDVSR